jgi:hypothetical protein
MNPREIKNAKTISQIQFTVGFGMPAGTDDVPDVASDIFFYP